MTESKDLIIISASCGKNLELSEKFFEKSNELQISSEILDLTTLDIPLFNPRVHNKDNIPCLLYTSPSPRDLVISRMPSSA